jgi:hypothetical protein
MLPPKHHQTIWLAIAVLSINLQGTVLAQPAEILGASASTTTPAVSAKQPYVDKLIEGLQIDDALDLEAEKYNSAGWSRSWHADYSLLYEKALSRSTYQALSLGGFVDTPDYGTLSLSANLSRQQNTRMGSAYKAGNSSWRINQRSMPLGNGWRADYSFGDISTGVTSLAQGTGRISLPSSPIRGVSGQWYQGTDLRLQASTGKTGLFSGFGIAGFNASSGQLSTAGAQLKLPFDASSGLGYSAIQIIEGQRLTDSSGAPMDTRAIWLAQSWEGKAPWATKLRPGNQAPAARSGGLRLQGNLLQSSASSNSNSNSTSENRRALGLWADANWRGERWRNSAGLFRFEPNLRWGSMTLASDIQGLYWQADNSTRQWQYGFSSELSERVSPQINESDGRSAFLNLNGRYRLDTRNSVGANLNLRALNGNGQALGLNWNRKNSWGQTQWRADWTRSGEVSSKRVGIDQNWALTAPASLNTSLAWETLTGGPNSGKNLIWGLQGSLPTTSQWSLDAALRGERRSNNSESINADLGLRWQSSGGWSLSLRYTESRGQQLQQQQILSALTAASLPTLTQLPAMRSLQLLLSYEEHAGRTYAPLGGAQGSAAGSLRGVVFFDADANDRREASEGGVPNITVILDRRYVTRTDAQGRYEFQAVAEGPHLVEISSDNVPLPWNPLLRSAIHIDINVRETSVYDFAVQRNK